MTLHEQKMIDSKVSAGSVSRWLRKVWTRMESSASLRPENHRLALESKGEPERYRYLPYVNLVYLVFLLMPLFFGQKIEQIQIIATLSSLALFLPLYFLSYRLQGRASLIAAAIMVGLCLAITPFNYGANTYLIYGVISAAYSMATRNALIFMVVSLLLLLTQCLYLGFPLVYIATTAVMASALVLYAIYNQKIARSNQRLKLSQQEVQRLAQSAERERIGRDLHDVLGHTMSLIVMKCELASRVYERDAAAALTQIREVEKIARESLGQIRMAVSGIRLAGLESELAHARQSLLSADIQLDYQLAPVVLDSNTESVLALAVRESITNVIRHANATRVEVELLQHKHNLQLLISDDGKAKVVVPGNGLNGMRERLHTIGAQLVVDTGPSGGVRLNITCPTQAA